MVQDLISEVNSCLSSQGTFMHYMEADVSLPRSKETAAGPCLSYLISDHTFIFYVFIIHLNIGFHLGIGLPNHLFSLNFLDQISIALFALYMRPP
jgi:hypothetical protein